MGWRPRELSGWAAGAWTFPTPSHTQPFPPPPAPKAASEFATWGTPGHGEGAPHMFWKKCFINVAMMFFSTTWKNSPKYLPVSLDSNLNSVCQCFSPHQGLPKSSHDSHMLFKVSIATSQSPPGRLSNVCKKAPVSSHEAEDFKRSSNTQKTAAQNSPGFSREMLVSYLENLRIRTPHSWTGLLWVEGKGRS